MTAMLDTSRQVGCMVHMYLESNFPLGLMKYFSIFELNVEPKHIWACSPLSLSHPLSTGHILKFFLELQSVKRLSWFNCQQQRLLWLSVQIGSADLTEQRFWKLVDSFKTQRNKLVAEKKGGVQPRHLPVLHAKPLLTKTKFPLHVSEPLCVVHIIISPALNTDVRHLVRRVINYTS